MRYSAPVIGGAAAASASSSPSAGAGMGAWCAVEIGMRADGRDQPRGEVAPVAQVCWKRGPDLGGAELEQSVTRATSEGALEPARRARPAAGARRPSTVNSRWPRGVSASDGMLQGASSMSGSVRVDEDSFTPESSDFPRSRRGCSGFARGVSRVATLSSPRWDPGGSGKEAGRWQSATCPPDVLVTSECGTRAGRCAPACRRPTASLRTLTGLNRSSGWYWRCSPEYW